MTPVEPTIPNGSRLVVLAKDQPQYDQLPAAVDDSGVMITEWVPTTEELHFLMMGGHVRLSTMTFGHPFQPVILEVAPPDVGVVKES